MSDHRDDDLPPWLAPPPPEGPMGRRPWAVAVLTAAWGGVLCFEWIARAVFSEPGSRLFDSGFTGAIGFSGVFWLVSAGCVAARRQWAPWLPALGAVVSTGWLVTIVDDRSLGVMFRVGSALVVPLVAGVISALMLYERLEQHMDELRKSHAEALPLTPSAGDDAPFGDETR